MTQARPFRASHYLEYSDWLNSSHVTNLDNWSWRYSVIRLIVRLTGTKYPLLIGGLGGHIELMFPGLLLNQDMSEMVSSWEPPVNRGHKRKYRGRGKEGGRKFEGKLSHDQPVLVVTLQGHLLWEGARRPGVRHIDSGRQVTTKGQLLY